MQTIRKVIIYTSKVYGMEKMSKRAWAEYFEVERKLVRQRFVIRVLVSLLVGLVVGLALDRL
jgi:hypothetical protein